MNERLRIGVEFAVSGDSPGPARTEERCAGPRGGANPS